MYEKVFYRIFKAIPIYFLMLRSNISRYLPCSENLGDGAFSCDDSLYGKVTFVEKFPLNAYNQQ